MMKLITLVALFISFFFFFGNAQTPKPFKCTKPANCQALIDYIPPNATTLFNIQTLFGVKNFRSILGANLMPVSASPNETIPAKQPIKIPFPCVCKNGTGISKNGPVYKVVPGDILDHIARDVFANLLTYQQIAEANKKIIKDVDKIDVGQEFKIPLPCSCDQVDSMDVVHYGHVVAAGSSVELIATRFGTKPETLLDLNGITDPNTLQAGQLLDVPLRACTSMINKTSPDYPLLVPNDTITFTANNCVQCRCDASNNWTLTCRPSHKEVKVPNWLQCRSTVCPGTDNLVLGNTTSGCPRTSCAYTGYNKDSILTTVVNDTTCSTDGAPGSNAIKNSLEGWSWRWLSLCLGLLGFGLVY